MSCQLSHNIPVVDISSFTDPSSFSEDDRLSTAGAWDEAMCEFGFAFVSNHGIPQSSIEQVRSGALEFFSKGISEKMRFNRGEYGGEEGGYTAVGTESVGRTLDSDDGHNNGDDQENPPDLVENYVIRAPQSPSSLTSAHPPELSSSCHDYYDRMVSLMHAMHEMSAIGLGLPSNYFRDYFEPPECALRLAHYPPLPESVVDGQLRYGAHTDYQCFTLLLQDDRDEGAANSGGLEVFLNGQGWTPVVPKPGCFIVNIGDLWNVWTNGRWHSTLHRVANPPRGSPAAKRDRLSVPFFTGPRSDALITPLHTCVNEGNPLKFQPISAGDHLRNKLSISNL